MTSLKTLGRALFTGVAAIALASCNSSGGSSNQSDSADTAGMTADESSSKQIRDAIAQASTHGLKSSLFLKGGESGDALVQAGLQYATALANGYSDPEKLFEVYTIDRANLDVRSGMRQALQQGNVGEWLNSLAPQTDEYRALGEAFQRYVKLADTGQTQAIGSEGVIKPNAQDDRVPAIAAFLRAGGYLQGNGGQPPATGGAASTSPAQGQQDASAGRTYTAEMVKAVKAYQSDSGLKSDGILGGNTLDELNNGAVDRARQLAASMERLRWLPRDPAKTRIDVNTAASLLDYWRDGQHVGQRKVVVGEPDKPTPQLQSPMYRLVAKPTWTVPKGIAEKELASKSQSWLAANDFVIEDGHYVQQSGPENSLGLVKFDMKNEHAIYLHDTPAKALFDVDNRHRSHGCVRVENATGFADMLANQEGIDDKFSEAMTNDEQTFVQLPNEIPVRLLYQTAFWDGSAVRYRKDYYGWDDNIAKALGLSPGRPRQIEQPESSDDIGP